MKDNVYELCKEFEELFDDFKRIEDYDDLASLMEELEPLYQRAKTLLER